VTAAVSYRLVLAAARYLCRHGSVGMYRLVDDSLRDVNLLPVFAELGAVEVVGGIPTVSRPEMQKWWTTYYAVSESVLYLETRCTSQAHTQSRGGE
jgi:hypothetical protein